MSGFNCKINVLICSLLMTRAGTAGPLPLSGRAAWEIRHYPGNMNENRDNITANLFGKRIRGKTGTSCAAWMNGFVLIEALTVKRGRGVRILTALWPPAVLKGACRVAYHALRLIYLDPAVCLMGTSCCWRCTAVRLSGNLWIKEFHSVVWTWQRGRHKERRETETQHLHPFTTAYPRLLITPT